MRISILAASITSLLLASASTGHAAVYLQDGFETYSSVNFWVDTSLDADPGTPAVGSAWSTFENLQPFQIQVVTWPQDLVGPPWAGGAGPTWAASGTGGAQYLHMWGYGVTNGYAAAPISGAGQTAITANAYVKLDVETFSLSGVDGWQGGLRITGWDDATIGTFVNKAFDVLLLPNGDVVNNSGNDMLGSPGTAPTYNAGYAKVAGLTHDVNVWENLSIVADFNSDTFSITLDGTTVSGLGWNASGLSGIQYITLAMPSVANPRGGYDNVTLSVPEPASLGLVLTGAMMFMKRRRAK